MAKLGVIHYNWPDFSFEDFLRAAAQSGYNYVELGLRDVWPDPQLEGDIEEMRTSAEKVRREVESHGLKISALGAGNDFVQSDSEEIARQVERMNKIAVLTRVLHEDAVVRSEGGQPKDDLAPEKWWDAMYECFTRCVPFLEETGVALAVDNHGYVTNEGDKLAALLDRIDHPLIGSNLDTMNFRWWGNDVETCNRYYELLAPRVLHVHLKDGFGVRKEYRGQALGEGEINLQHALECLRDVGYKGVYAAEYEGPEAAGGVGYDKCAQWMKANIEA